VRYDKPIALDRVAALAVADVRVSRRDLDRRGVDQVAYGLRQNRSLPSRQDRS